MTGQLHTKRLLAGALAATLAVLAAGAVQARDLAVIISNRLPGNVGGRDYSLDVSALRGALNDAGFDQVVLNNASARDMQERFVEIRRDLQTASRLVVVVAGRVATDGTNSWVLGTQVRNANSFNVGSFGLPLTALYPYFAELPGASILAVVAPSTGRIGSGLEPGFLPGDLPQGLTVLSGDARSVSSLLVQDVLRSGVALGAAVDQSDGDVVGYGFLPKQTAFLALEEEDLTEADLAAWDQAQRANTEEAYAAYLQRYPEGLRARDALNRLNDLRQTPQARAEAGEAALRLDRDTKREIQRNLSILGFDPRGVDGIFGRGTRRAIGDWQREAGFDATGFMTGNQIELLRRTGAQRQAALEEQARRRQEEADREDTAFWRDTGRGSSESGMREYLSRYPDGLFSDLAGTRLTEIEAQRRGTAARAEREDWERALRQDNVAGYQAYLRAYPQGTFAVEAQSRLGELRTEGQRGDEIAKARADEARVLANPVTRLLVERRLQQLGLKPGKADGKFDQATRKAVRRYQKARELPVTGFVTQATLVRLLSG
jgi:peptidoglycan hydrolase-like protein with peptidoglycan-binding domain